MLTSKKPQNNKEKTTIFTLAFSLLFISFISISLFYLSHSNQIATNGYVIKAAYDNMKSLQLEKDVWSLKLRNLQSVSFISNSDKILSMSDIDIVAYKEIESHVALR